MKSSTIFMRICLPILLLLWGIASSQQVGWYVHAIFAAIIAFLSLIFFLLRKVPASPKKEHLGLPEKLYTTVLLTTASLYTLGIWLSTPATHPAYLKALFLVTGLLIQLGILTICAFKPIQEQPDERFFFNVYKSASIFFMVLVLSLLVIGIVSLVLSLTLQLGHVFIFVSAHLLLFCTVFLRLEKAGG